MTKGVIGADVWPLFDLFLSSILSEFVISDLRPVVRDPTVLAGSGNTGTVIWHQPSLSHFSVSYCPIPCMYPPIHDCILCSIYIYFCVCVDIYIPILYSALFPFLPYNPILFHAMFTYSHIRCMCMCRYIYSILCSVMFSLFIQSHIMFIVLPCYIVCALYVIPYYVPHIPSSYLVMPPLCIVCALYVIPQYVLHYDLFHCM